MKAKEGDIVELHNGRIVGIEDDAPPGYFALNTDLTGELISIFDKDIKRVVYSSVQ
jgi:hypothetical protein